MQAYPHHYPVTASASADSDVVLNANNLPEITTAAPPEFDGPGDRWSPESLLVGAVADCFILSFRAIARASELEWIDLRCTATGVLDRVDRVTQFTAIEVSAELTLPAGGDTHKAEKLLHRAESSCLVSNSLKAPRSLKTTINVAYD
jgi:peroxiredoxin-like protein